MKLHLLAALGAALFLQAAPAQPTAPETVPPANAGVPTRARVVIAQDPAATATFAPVPERLPGLLERGLTHLLQRPTARAAWLSLITTQDTVGVKVFTSPGPTIGTRPAVVEAVVRSLLNAGLPARQIVIWDKHLADLRSAGLFSLAERYGVRVAGSAEAGYDDRFAYDKELLGRLVWGDLEFGRDAPSAGRKSHLSNLISRQVTKIVSVSPLLNHNLAGVSGNLYGLAVGSVDNTLRFANSAGRLAEAVPEIMAELIADRVVLCITDALLCQYQGEAQPLLHYSAPLNQLWFSQDPVALDVLAVEEIERQRQGARIPGTKPNLELYQNATALELGVSSLKDIDIIRLPDS
jgi:hypothetical protein